MNVFKLIVYTDGLKLIFILMNVFKLIVYTAYVIPEWKVGGHCYIV